MLNNKEINRKFKNASWDYLIKLYQPLEDNFNNAVNDTACSHTNGQRDLIYGEIFFESFWQLCNKFPAEKEDVFLDCGAGFGKLCLQILLHSPVHKVYGIEKVSERAKVANQIIQSFVNDCPEIIKEQEAKIINDDIFNIDRCDATICFTNSTAFSDETIHGLGLWLNKQPKLHTVMSLKPIPSLKLPFKQAIPVECSWDTVMCYVYKLLK